MTLVFPPSSCECRFCVIAGNITPIDVITHVPILCEEADIPYVYVPSKEVSWGFYFIFLHHYFLRCDDLSILFPILCRFFRMIEVFLFLSSFLLFNFTHACMDLQAKMFLGFTPRSFFFFWQTTIKQIIYKCQKSWYKTDEFYTQIITMISGKKCLLGFVCSLKMSHLMKFENPVHLQWAYLCVWSGSCWGFWGFMGIMIFQKFYLDHGGSSICSDGFINRIEFCIQMLCDTRVISFSCDLRLCPYFLCIDAYW